MTREEAIKRLKEYAQYSYGIWHNDEEDTKAFDMAIEALSADVDCSTCKHKDKDWDSEECDSCCGNNNHYTSADAVQGEECDHCVYKWGMKGGDSE